MVFNDLWGEATCSNKSLILNGLESWDFLHGSLGKLDITGVESGDYMRRLGELRRGRRRN